MVGVKDSEGRGRSSSVQRVRQAKSERLRSARHQSLGQHEDAQLPISRLDLPIWGWQPARTLLTRCRAMLNRKPRQTADA